MKRVMIIGQPGSGKSTLAREMGDITGLPVVHIDHIHWQPGWVERPREEKTRLCHEVEARERWIFEGGHSTTWPERLSRADMVVWLDVGVWTRLARVLRRTVTFYGRTRPDLPEGCPEQFSREFLAFIWRTRHSARRNILRLLSDVPSGKAVHHLSTPREVAHFLDDLRRAYPDSAAPSASSA